MNFKKIISVSLVLFLGLSSSFAQESSKVFNSRIKLTVKDGAVDVKTNYLTYHSIEFATPSKKSYAIVSPASGSIVQWRDYKKVLNDKKIFKDGSWLPTGDWKAEDIFPIKINEGASTSVNIKSELGEGNESSDWRAASYVIRSASLNNIISDARDSASYDYPQVVLLLNSIKLVDLTSEIVAGTTGKGDAAKFADSVNDVLKSFKSVQDFNETIDEIGIYLDVTSELAKAYIDLETAAKKDPPPWLTQSVRAWDQSRALIKKIKTALEPMGLYRPAPISKIADTRKGVEAEYRKILKNDKSINVAEQDLLNNGLVNGFASHMKGKADAVVSPSGKTALLMQAYAAPFGQLVDLRVKKLKKEMDALTTVNLDYLYRGLSDVKQRAIAQKEYDLLLNDSVKYNKIKKLRRDILAWERFNAFFKLFGVALNVYSFTDMCDNYAETDVTKFTEECVHELNSAVREVGYVAIKMMADRIYEKYSKESMDTVVGVLEKSEKLKYISKGFDNINAVAKAANMAATFAGEGLPFLWDFLISPPMYEGTLSAGKLDGIATPVSLLNIDVTSKNGVTRSRTYSDSVLQQPGKILVPGELGENIKIQLKVNAPTAFDTSQNAPWETGLYYNARPVYYSGWSSDADGTGRYVKNMVCVRKLMGANPLFSVQTQSGLYLSSMSDFDRPSNQELLGDDCGLKPDFLNAGIYLLTPNEWFSDFSKSNQNVSYIRISNAYNQKNIPNQFNLMNDGAADYPVVSIQFPVDSWDGAWRRIWFNSDILNSYSIVQNIALVPYITQTTAEPTVFWGLSDNGALVKVDVKHNGSSADQVQSMDWVWGDGVATSGLGEHVYTKPGIYTGKVIAHTLSGQDISASFTVKIEAAAIKSTPTTPTAGQAVILWIEDAWATIKQVVWNFGAGLTDLVASVTDGKSQDVTRTFNTSGTKTVTVTYKDQAGVTVGQQTMALVVSPAKLPAAPVVTSAVRGSDGKVIVQGTAEKGIGVKVTWPDGAFNQVLADAGTGAWSMTSASTAYTAIQTVSVVTYVSAGSSAPVVVSITGKPVATASKLPDTGITANQCYAAGSNTLVSCTSAAAIALNPKQDGMVGRDVSSPSATDGKLGFSYSTVGSYSKEECVKDNITGLTWEGKPTSGWRAADKTYTNYDSTAVAQFNTGANVFVNPTRAQVDAASNIVGYIMAVNNSKLCGYTDWRLPTFDELQGLVDYGAINSDSVIDNVWFLNTKKYAYWTSTGYYPLSEIAWMIHFGNGVVDTNFRSYGAYVRLVR